MTAEPQITGYRWAKMNKTQQLIAERSAPKRRNKFNARRVTIDGQTFDSMREYAHWMGLKLREKAGEIYGLQRQNKFRLEVNGELIANYRADFTYWGEDDRLHVVDVKSAPTAKKRDFVLIRKLMRACHGIEVEVLI